MKIAVCFSGQLRTGLRTVSNIRRFFGRNLDIDVFMHTWNVSQDKEWFPGKFTERQERPITHITAEHISFLKNSYNIVDYEIENYEEFTLNYKEDLISPPLFYSWYKSIKLMTEYESKNDIRYSVCVKLRPDVIFPANRRLVEEMTNVDVHTLYVENLSNARIDDVFWVASPYTMKTLSPFFFEHHKKETFLEYTNRIGIRVCGLQKYGYTIYRTEALSWNPLLAYEKCFNIDRDFYAPASNTHRL